jgi:hypothetical protein
MSQVEFLCTTLTPQKKFNARNRPDLLKARVFGPNWNKADAFLIDALLRAPLVPDMESSGKKTPFFDKLLILGGALTFMGLTIAFSPMLWMATILALLPILVMFVLITPTLHLNIVERQTEDNRAK